MVCFSMAPALAAHLRRFLPSLTAFVVIMTVASAAATPVRHLHLERSSPADSSVVSAPDSLMLWFSERPQIAVTRVTVTTASGDTVAAEKPVQAAGDKAPVVVRFARPPASGAHTVAWRTMSADGHTVRGTFMFTVRAGTP